MGPVARTPRPIRPTSSAADPRIGPGARASASLIDGLSSSDRTARLCMSENTTPKPRLDPRAPFVVNTKDLARGPGEMRPLRRRVPAPAELGLEMTHVAEDAPLDLDLRLESVSEGILVSGTVTAPVTGECARCLDPIDDVLTVDLQELFAYPDSITEDTTDEDEVHRLVGDLLDLEPVVRDAVVLGLPFSPLCQPECAGLCPECGQRLDDLPEGHAHDQIDPRWAGLTDRLDPPAQP